MHCWNCRVNKLIVIPPGLDGLFIKALFALDPVVGRGSNAWRKGRDIEGPKNRKGMNSGSHKPGFGGGGGFYSGAHKPGLWG